MKLSFRFWPKMLSNFAFKVEKSAHNHKKWANPTISLYFINFLPIFVTFKTKFSNLLGQQLKKNLDNSNHFFILVVESLKHQNWPPKSWYTFFLGWISQGIAVRDNQLTYKVLPKKYLEWYWVTHLVAALFIPICIIPANIGSTTKYWILIF